MDNHKRRNFKKYGLGKERSLKDYETYSGIRFKDRQVQQYTYDRKPPPSPFTTKKQYESTFVSKFKYCIDIHKPTFTENDYDVWVVAFKNDKDEDLVRLDAQPEEFNNLLNLDPSDDFVRMWREFETSEVPHKWLVWPHSISKGWMPIIESLIPQI